MNESELKQVYIFFIYLIGSIITTDKRFVSIDNGTMGGFHWACFYLNENKSFYFDSFGGQCDEFLKTITKTDHFS